MKPISSPERSRSSRTTDVPICIDSSVVEALEAGLAVYEGKALVNSVTCARPPRASAPLVKQHGAAVICLVNDETGIPQTADARLEVCARLVEIVHGEYEIPMEDIVIDPLAMTVGADPQAVVITLDDQPHRDEFNLNMTLGASNTSFGLPSRHALNAAFLVLASFAGLTSAIMDARTAQTVDACRAAIYSSDGTSGAWPGSPLIDRHRRPRPRAHRGPARHRGRHGRAAAPASRSVSSRRVRPSGCRRASRSSTQRRGSRSTPRGGHGTCKKCRVQVVEGAVPPPARRARSRRPSLAGAGGSPAAPRPSTTSRSRCPHSSHVRRPRPSASGVR